MLGIAGFLAMQFRDLDQGVRALINLKGEAMQTISQEAFNTEGKKATITTQRNWNEALDAWLARHAAAVSAFEAT